MPNTVNGETALIRLPYTYGALAQLVARYIRIVEVTGSNPVCSTTKSFSKEKDFCIIYVNRHKKHSI